MSDDWFDKLIRRMDERQRFENESQASRRIEYDLLQRHAEEFFADMSRTVESYATKIKEKAAVTLGDTRFSSKAGMFEFKTGVTVILNLTARLDIRAHQLVLTIKKTGSNYILGDAQIRRYSMHLDGEKRLYVRRSSHSATDGIYNGSDLAKATLAELVNDELFKR